MLLIMISILDIWRKVIIDYLFCIFFWEIPHNLQFVISVLFSCLFQLSLESCLTSLSSANWDRVIPVTLSQPDVSTRSASYLPVGLAGLWHGGWEGRDSEGLAGVLQVHGAAVPDWARAGGALPQAVQGLAPVLCLWAGKEHSQIITYLGKGSINYRQ